MLRGQVLGAITAPLMTVVGLFTAPLRDLVGLLEARIEQLAGSADAESADAGGEAETSAPPRPSRRQPPKARSGGGAPIGREQTDRGTHGR